jgi:hypothetical protein
VIIAALDDPFSLKSLTRLEDVPAFFGDYMMADRQVPFNIIRA